jgi:hypothetical protein
MPDREFLLFPISHIASKHMVMANASRQRSLAIVDKYPQHGARSVINYSIALQNIKNS